MKIIYTSPNTFVLVLFVLINVACSPKVITLVDSRDGKTYPTVNIDSYVWMASNLSYKMEGAFAYDNSNEIAEKMGLLYLWDASLKACPTGWHLPSDKEWSELEQALGNESMLGTRLKSPTDWNNEGNGTNSEGFNILPAGYVGYGGKRSASIGDKSFFWTSTSEGPGSEDRVWRRYLHMDSTTVNRDQSYKDNGYSVRCVKD